MRPEPGPHSYAHRPRPCAHCHEILPPDAFDMGASGKRRKGVCRDCVAKDAAAREQRQAERRVTWQDPHTRRWMRRCGKCGEVKPLATAFNWADRGHTEYHYRCKVCESARSSARRKARIADPTTRTEERAKRVRWALSWRQRNPEKYREQQRRYKERKKRDPKRVEHERAMMRERHRLKAEAEGRTVRSLKASRMGPVRGTVDDEPGGHLPARPLAEVIARRVAATDLTVEDVCNDLGVNVRTFSAWRSGEREFVQFDVADRVLCRLGLNWFDAYDDEVFPEAHARAAELFG